MLRLYPIVASSRADNSTITQPRCEAATGTVTTRLQRRHLSSMPCGVTRAIKLPQWQRTSV